MRFFNGKIKDKQYYIDKHKELYDECLVKAREENSNDVTAGTDTLYDECATAKHIVGYYLYWYGDSALSTWESNLLYAKERTGNETDTDKEVTCILKKIFK